jgi:predicted extracellular nuclease
MQDNDGNTNSAITSGEESGSRLSKAIAAAGGPTYTYLEIQPEDDTDGGIPGGNIRVAFLYDASKVELVPSFSGSTGTPTEGVKVIGAGNGTRLSVNPGRLDPTNAAFTRSRKPLAAHFKLKSGAQFFVINVHFTSKGGSQQLGGPIQPPANGGEDSRLAQAAVVNNFVSNIFCARPQANVIVLGDFNEFTALPPLQVRLS